VNGTVRAFDDARGRGVIVADDGTEYEFHATRIADGTRSITIGTAVHFEVVPALLGRWEASAITRC
jgi:cold shock CspA family protein